MSRSGYTEDIDDYWPFIKYRGQVTSALRGKRGQRFLRDLITALDEMPEKRLVAGTLSNESGCCAMGAVARHRGVSVDDLALHDEDDDGVTGEVGRRLDIAGQLAREVAFVNDEDVTIDTPEQRWSRVRKWAVLNLQEGSQS